MFDLYRSPIKEAPRFWCFEIQKTPSGTYALYGIESDKDGRQFGEPEFEGNFSSLQDADKMLGVLVGSRKQRIVAVQDDEDPWVVHSVLTVMETAS